MQIDAVIELLVRLFCFFLIMYLVMRWMKKRRGDNDD